MFTYGSKPVWRYLFGIILVLGIFLMLTPNGAMARVDKENVPYLTKELALNSSVDGDITATDKVHYYTVTLEEDGKLTLELKGDVNTKGILALYDVNGYVQLEKTQVEGRTPGGIYYNLAPGTYFIKVERSDREWSYKLSSTFESTPHGVPDDQEPNDIYQLAKEMDLNAAVTGRLGYYTDGYTDKVDWWKVTTTEDGLLKFDIEAIEGINAEAAGALKLHGIYCSRQLQKDEFSYHNETNTASVEYHLMPGTYYIEVERSEGAWGYRLTSAFVSAAYPNDSDANNVFTTAQTLPLGGSSTGHLGYYGNDEYRSGDSDDWWKITTTEDGELTINVQATDNAKGKVYLYNVYISSLDYMTLGTDNSPLEGSITKKVKAGEYYVLVKREDNAWSYKISNSFVPKIVEGDLPQVEARTLPLNDRGCGEISKVNKIDWWKVTTEADGLLTLSFKPDQESKCYIRVYEQDRTTYMASGSTLEKNEWEFSRNLQPGTYYIKVERYYDKSFTYTLSSTFSPAPLANDPEPNDVIECAQVLPTDGFVTGHLGYFRNGKYDNHDWWEITTTEDGILEISFESNIETNVMFYLNDRNGRILGDHYSKIKEKTLSYPLQPDTYYVRLMVSSAHYSAFSYTLSSTFTPAALANDPEPNDIGECAGELPLDGEVTGHIGYYRDKKYDKVDWWKVTTGEDGLLEIKLETTRETDFWLHLYDQNGSKQIAGNPNQDMKEYTIKRHLQPGAYYVRVHEGGLGTGGFSYTLSTSFTRAPLAVDKEPNFHYRQAGFLTLNKAATGHLGYYSNYFYDEKDWWKVHVPEAGTLTVNIMPTDKPSTMLYIYGPDASSQLSSALINKHLEPGRGEAKISEPGDYYVLLSGNFSSSTPFSYYITASLTADTITAPAIITTYPQKGAKVEANFGEVEVAVLATFNKKMKESSLLEPGAFKLLDSKGNPVKSDVKYKGTMVCLIPKFSLEKGSYTAVISERVEDDKGVALGSDYYWTFTIDDAEDDPDLVPVVLVTVEPGAMNLEVAASKPLIANIFPLNADNKAVQWSSSDALVAKVDQNGLVTAISPGQAIITVTSLDRSKTAACLVTVVGQSHNIKPEASNVHITGDYMVGSTLIGNYEYYDADGHEEGESSYRWLIADEVDGSYTLIPDARSITYLVSAVDAGKYIKFEVTPMASQTLKFGETVLSDPIYIELDKCVEWEAKESQYPKDKNWTIVLNKMIDPASLKGVVYVKDSQGQTVDQLVILADFEPKITLLPPNGGYAKGEYTLFIENTLRSVEGAALKQAIKMKFAIK